jgi:hypothetical protein
MELGVKGGSRGHVVLQLLLFPSSFGAPAVGARLNPLPPDSRPATGSGMPSGRSGSLPHFLRWFSLCRRRCSSSAQPERKLVCHAVYSERCCGWDERSGLWTLGIGAHTCTIVRPQVSLNCYIEGGVRFLDLPPRGLLSFHLCPNLPNLPILDIPILVSILSINRARSLVLSCYRAIVLSYRAADQFLGLIRSPF